MPKQHLILGLTWRTKVTKLKTEINMNKNINVLKTITDENDKNEKICHVSVTTSLSHMHMCYLVSLQLFKNVKICCIWLFIY